MGRYGYKFIGIFINFMEIIINYLKKEEKSRGNTYKINHISVDNFPKVAKLVSK